MTMDADKARYEMEDVTLEEGRRLASDEPAPARPPPESQRNQAVQSQPKKGDRQGQSRPKKAPKELIVPDELSLNDRDPNEVHRENGNDLKVSFEDIFAEPKGLHSKDDVWVCTYKTYNGSKYWSYRICTLICAVPAAILWGISFACLAFCHIWCVVPFVKAFLLQLKCFGRIFAIYVRTCCDPLYTSAALMFSRIRVNFNRSEGSEGNFYSKYEQGLY